jgi:peroxiredoxin
MKHLGVTACALTLVLGCSSAIPTLERPLAPDFTLPEDVGGSLALSSLRGSWVLLHFTASWCPYCDSEIAHLGEIADRYAERGVKVVLVDEKEPEAQWRAYAQSHVSKSVIAVRDEDGSAALRYAPPHAQPSFADRSQVVLDATLIVDPDGVIRLFLLPDSAHFDPTFVAVRSELDRLLAADVVHVALQAPAQSQKLVAVLDVAPGYHVMSHTPTEPQYIPTRIEAVAEGVTFGEPIYPPGDTYERTARVVLPYVAPANASDETASRRVAVTVSYQACTASRCLFPTRRRIETLLTFNAGDTP